MHKEACPVPKVYVVDQSKHIDNLDAYSFLLGSLESTPAQMMWCQEKQLATTLHLVCGCTVCTLVSLTGTWTYKEVYTCGLAMTHVCSLALLQCTPMYAQDCYHNITYVASCALLKMDHSLIHTIVYM